MRYEVSVLLFFFEVVDIFVLRWFVAGSFRKRQKFHLDNSIERIAIYGGRNDRSQRNGRVSPSVQHTPSLVLSFEWAVSFRSSDKILDTLKYFGLDQFVLRMEADTARTALVIHWGSEVD